MIQKSIGCSKSSYKREDYSDTCLPQKTRKIANKQPNTMPKGTQKKNSKQNPKLVEGKK